MTETSDRRRPLNLQLREFTMYNLSVDNDWLEVSQFVLQLTLLIFTSKEVDSFLNRVALSNRINYEYFY